MFCSNVSEPIFDSLVMKTGKILETFSKFYHRYSALIFQYMSNIGLKSILQKGISEPIFYSDIVYKFK